MQTAGALPRPLELNKGIPLRMAKNPGESSRQAHAEFDLVVAELYEKGRASEFGISGEEFRQILWSIGEKYLGSGVSHMQLQEFCRGLRIEELVLARACASGHERAWEVFLTRYRAKLYDIAGYITKESSAARELADSIYADLYGMHARDGHRVSKLASYTGRGSLEGWLRTVIAQEYINRYRRHRRNVSLDEEVEAGAQFASPQPAPAQTIDPRLESATDEALEALPAEDRFVLAAYYLDGRTLAEIARTVVVHESTICRKIEKLGRRLRKQILAGLSQRGMSRRQAMEALEADVRDLAVDIRKRLAQDLPIDAFPNKKMNVPASEGSGGQ